jgi:predicted DNA-binding transcriptional regulator AlpA
MKPDLPQGLLNEHEVSKICAIQVATLRKWRTLRRGPRFLKIGALVRYRPDDISAWIDSQAAVPCDEVGVAR